VERFFDGTNQEISEIQGGKVQIRKIQKKQEGKNGGKKKMRLFCLRYVEVPILVCSPSVGNTPPLQHKILLTSRQEHPNLFFNKKSVFHYVGERFRVHFF